VGAAPLAVSPIKLVEPFYLRYWTPTTPLWFLLSLFWVNVLFYALQRCLHHRGLLVATWVISLLGYGLGVAKVQLPLMLDTSLVALPYFVLGWEVKRQGGLQPHACDRWGIVVLIVVAMPIYVLSEFMNLHFQVLPPYWKLYLLPFIAILALFWACKNLPYIPIFCHYGRYSLIILGTHPLLVIAVRFLFLRQGTTLGIATDLAIFAIVMAMEWPIIWLLKTYAPRLTAQKPFFYPGWRLTI